MNPAEIRIYGSLTRYWEHGPADAPVVLAVHGFRGNHLGLERIIDEVPGYRFVVPDLPGFGLSSPMTERRHDVEGYAEFTRAFASALGLTRPVVLGHSFGSVIAAHLAATAPEELSALMLVSPIAVSPGAGPNAPVSKLVEAYYWLSTNLPEALGMPILMSRTFNRLMTLTLTKSREPSMRAMIYRHHLGDLEFGQDRGVIAESFADSISKTAADEADRITTPTLLVAGDSDSLSPLRYQVGLHDRIPGSTLVLIPGVGHLVHLETPSQAARAIEDFLVRLSDRQTAVVSEDRDAEMTCS